MKRAWWVKHVEFCFIAVVGVGMLDGTAWADPPGTASVFQFLTAKVFPADEGAQQYFRTTDSVGFRADYFDPNPACQGVAPVLAQLFIFTAEGHFEKQVSVSNGPGSFGAKSRGVFTQFASAASIPLAPGSYTAAFLVRDCADMNSIVLAPFLRFRVVAP